MVGTSCIRAKQKVLYIRNGEKRYLALLVVTLDNRDLKSKTHVFFIAHKTIWSNFRAENLSTKFYKRI